MKMMKELRFQSPTRIVGLFDLEMVGSVTVEGTKVSIPYEDCRPFRPGEVITESAGLFKFQSPTRIVGLFDQTCVAIREPLGRKFQSPTRIVGLFD